MIILHRIDCTVMIVVYVICCVYLFYEQDYHEKDYHVISIPKGSPSTVLRTGMIFFSFQFLLVTTRQTFIRMLSLSASRYESS